MRILRGQAAEDAVARLVGRGHHTSSRNARSGKSLPTYAGKAIRRYATMLGNGKSWVQNLCASLWLR